MFPTPQLAGLNLSLGREGRVVEEPQCGEISVTLHVLVGFDKQVWILRRTSLYIAERVTSVTQLYTLKTSTSVLHKLIDYAHSDCTD